MQDNEKFHFIKNKKNKEALLHDGYRYNFVSNNSSGTSFWRCYKRQECSASLTLNQENTIIIRKSLHKCEQDHDKMQEDLLLDTAKQNVCKDMSSVKKVYEEVVQQLPSSSTFNGRPYNSVKDVLYRHRKRFLQVQKTEFSKSSEVTVPNMIKKDFLIAEFELPTDDKMLVFSSRFSKRNMKMYADQEKVFFGDGTFKSAPRPFYQLFTIHVDIDSTEETTNIFPVLYALLPNKRETTYFALFTIIRDVLKVHIKHFKCDYELGLINAFRTVYPNAKVTGCFYHYNKSVWKKANDIGLTKSQEGRYITKITANLPLLPASYIQDGWAAIVECSTQSPEMNAFASYFCRQWLKNPLLISCAKQKHRTNNKLEAWHRRLNVRMQHNPTLLQFLFYLKKEAHFQDKKNQNSLFEPNNKKRNTILFNRKYQRELNKLETKEITLLYFLKNVSDLKRKFK